jgi:pullulanase
MHKLAAVVVLTSHGIPMIQMGQEAMRTKFGVENSYCSSDEINRLRWNSIDERKDHVAYFKGLISLRKAHPELFSLPTADLVRRSLVFYEDLDNPDLTVPPRCIAYQCTAVSSSPLRYDFDDGWSSVVVLLNPNPVDITFPLPEVDAFQHWVSVLDDERAGVVPLDKELHFGSVIVRGRSARILRRASTAENSRGLLALRLSQVSDPRDSTSQAVGLVVPQAVGLVVPQPQRH